jgi:hypothetical protein
MAERHTRNLIRVFIGAALGSAIVASAAVPVPDHLPAVAFGQTSLYRLQVALLVFYGGLLLITPAISGLVMGRLPIEISTRGARFAEEADQSDELVEATIRELSSDIRHLADRMNAVEAGDQAPKGRDRR